jgi:hypothetical protein
MLQLIRNILHNRDKDALELSRWNTTWEQYRRWLNEFPQIAKVLDNMFNEVKGKDSMDAGWPPREEGPWTVSNLREHLRRQNLNVQPEDKRFDKDWYDEFNKKHEELTKAQARIAELEAQHNEAGDLLILKNREVNNLRFVCAQVYEVVVDTHHVNKRVLDNLYAVVKNKPLPAGS